MGTQVTFGWRRNRSKAKINSMVAGAAGMEGMLTMVGLRLIVPVEGNDFMVIQIWRRGHTRFTRECHEKECRYDCPKIDHIRSYIVPWCEASAPPIISLTRQTIWFSAGAAPLASDWPPRPRQRSDSGGTDEYPVRGCFPVQPMRNGRGILGRCAAMTPAPTHMTCLAHGPSTSNAENLGDGADPRSAVFPSYDQAPMTHCSISIYRLH